MNFKKQVLTLLLAMLATVGFVSAENNACDPCYQSDPCACDRCDPCHSWCDGFCLGVDFLWWHPCLHDMDYAVVWSPAFTSSGEINGKFHQICHDYDPGVRVALYKECFWCDWDLAITYTYYHSEETDRVRVDTSNEVNLTLIHPDFATYTNGDTIATGRHKLSYQTIDALFGREFCWCPDHRFMPFFGIEGLKLDRHLTTVSETTSANTDTVFSWNADLKALGLKIGTEYTHTLCDCLELFARASASMLAGELEAESQSHNPAVPPAAPSHILNLDHADCCIFIPGYHLQAGFTYCTCCCNQEMVWRLGYEFLEWKNVPTPKRFFTNAVAGYEGASTRGTGTTLGMHGVFAGMEFCF